MTAPGEPGAPAPATAPGEGDEVVRRARRLRWLLLDVDGVLTDGRLYYGARGEELKVFDVKDGLGLRLLHDAGIKFGLLSSRASAALEQRARELGVHVLLVGEPDKGAALDRFLAGERAEPAEVAYIGDDLPDLPVLRRVGLALAPADAASEVRERVHVVLEAAGGHGAVREAVELILRARGEWERALGRFLVF